MSIPQPRALSTGLAGACLSSMLVAYGAFAQVETQIVINPLSAAESGGCYAGTAGSDATMFVRAEPGLSGCDLSDPFDDFCLARREFPGDGANGTSVSFGDMALLRPSLTGDGIAALFVRNLDLCLMITSTFQQDICYDLPGPNGFFVHGIGIAPQGTLLGLIPRDLNNINVPANALQIFGVGAFPALQLLATFPFTSPVLYPETVDLQARGPWLVFDASTSPFPGGSWALYVIDRNTGELRTLVPAVPGFELRNPVFGQTSDDVIAFEAVSTTAVASTVLAADIVTGEVRKIADVGLAAAVPSFNGDDTEIIFNREDPSVFSTASLRERTVLGDRITPSGAERAHLLNGGYATVYRRGTFDDSSVACPEPTTTLGLGVAWLGMVFQARGRARLSRGS